MGRSLVILLAVLFFVKAGYSQNCVVSNAADSGLVFPIFYELPCIDTGQFYNNALQIRMPGQFHGIINLDSMVITSITGLPTGIDYAFNPSSTLYPDSNTCISLYGTTDDTLGTYALIFNGWATFTTDTTGPQTYSLTQLAGISDAPIPTYQLIVTYPGDTGCHSVYSDSLLVYGTSAINPINPLEALRVYPNPSEGIFQIALDKPLVAEAIVVIANELGQTIYSKRFPTGDNLNTSLDLSKCAKGYYTLQLKSATSIVSKKIIID